MYLPEYMYDQTENGSTTIIKYLVFSLSTYFIFMLQTLDSRSLRIWPLAGA